MDSNVTSSVIESVPPTISAILSFPVILLIAIILWRKEIKCLILSIITKLEHGEIHSLSLSSIKIEFSEAIQDNSIILESIPFDNENLDFLKKRRKVLEVELSKEQNNSTSYAKLYYSVKYLYNSKGLKVLVFTNEKKFIGTTDVEEFLSYFEKEKPIYLQAYEQAYAKFLCELANKIEGKPIPSYSSKESYPRKSFKKYEELIKKLGPSKDESFTEKTLERLREGSPKILNEKDLQLTEEGNKKYFSTEDLLKALNFESDFIPITNNDKYCGIVEKSYIVQLIIENLLKTNREKEIKSVKNNPCELITK